MSKRRRQIRYYWLRLNSDSKPFCPCAEDGNDGTKAHGFLVALISNSDENAVKQGVSAICENHIRNYLNGRFRLIPIGSKITGRTE